MLTDEQIAKFQTLYKSRFGEEISREEVYAKALRLIRLIELVYRPVNESERQQSQEHRRKNGDL